MDFSWCSDITADIITHNKQFMMIRAVEIVIFVNQN